jgi:hypothetical protein
MRKSPKGRGASPNLTTCTLNSLLTPLVALYPPTTLAITAIYLSCLLANPPVALPSRWWELFDVESEDEIWSVSRTLLECYRTWGVDVVAGKGDEDLWTRAARKALPVTKAEVREWLDRRNR